MSTNCLPVSVPSWSHSHLYADARVVIQQDGGVTLHHGHYICVGEKLLQLLKLSRHGRLYLGN